MVPLAQILEAVRHRHPSRILEVGLRDTHNRLVYHVKLVNAPGVAWYLRCHVAQETLLHTHKEKAR